MKYMLLMNYAPGVPPITEWAPEDLMASGAHTGAIHEWASPYPGAAAAAAGGTEPMLAM
jgi:hypothetical protein